MSDDKEPIGLRDQLAIQIFISLLEHEPDVFISDIKNYLKRNKDFPADYIENKLNVIANVKIAYMLADAFRKARLIAFK